MIDSQTWLEIRNGFESTDVDIAVAACEALHEKAETDDVPRLLELLNDSNFFVREAAAWPLVELAGAQVLPQLVVAYQRGFDDGHDNDGFTAALLEIPALFPGTKGHVTKLSESAEGTQRELFLWLLTFY